jgi:hypothetical protein
VQGINGVLWSFIDTKKVKSLQPEGLKDWCPKVELDSFSLVDAAFRKVWLTPYLVKLPTGTTPSK